MAVGGTTDALNALRLIGENAGWLVPHEATCWVIERPRDITLDWIDAQIDAPVRHAMIDIFTAERFIAEGCATGQCLLLAPGLTKPDLAGWARPLPCHLDVHWSADAMRLQGNHSLWQLQKLGKLPAL
jgi:hypothetical protein